MNSKNSLYKVVFDTNVVWLNDEDKVGRLFNSSISESVKFIKSNKLAGKVSLAIPEIVLQERIEQTLNQINEILKKIENGFMALSGFGVKITDNKYKKNYGAKVKGLLKKILLENKIEVIKTPKFNRDNLIKRSLKKIKPFHGDGDKGFKDTLIWLSILDDVRRHKATNYVLCTSNIRDFDFRELSGEFKNVGKGCFKIVNDLKDLKKFLDKEFNLKLKLKELYKQIENEIKMKIGELMVSFNEQNLKNDSDLSTYYNYAVTVTRVYPWLNDGEDDIIGYDFGGIDIKDINQLRKNYFELKANLLVSPRYKKERKKPLGSRFSPMDFSLRNHPEHQLYSIVFSYDKTSGFLGLLSSSKSLTSAPEYNA